MGLVIYAVLLTKAMAFEVEAATEDEACALAIAVALGHTTPGVHQRVRFGGKSVTITSCEAKKHLDSASPND